MVDIAAMVNVENMHDAGRFVDEVHDPVGSHAAAAQPFGPAGHGDAVRRCGVADPLPDGRAQPVLPRVAPGNKGLHRVCKPDAAPEPVLRCYRTLRLVTPSA